MTAPHIASDNTAIDAAHQRRMENARNALDAAVAAFHLRPAPRWHLEALIRAAGALRDEAIAGLERAHGRQDGGFRGEGYERPPAAGKGSCACPPGYEDGGCVFEPPVCPRKAVAAITHTPGSPMHSLGGSMHERTEARLAAAAEIAGHYRPGPHGHSEAPRRDIEHTSPTGRLEHAQADFARPMVPR